MSETNRNLADAAVVRAYNRQRSTAARRRVEGDLRTPEIILGERVASLRQRQGLTAEQLAEKITEIGGPVFDRATISRIEGGHRGVSLNEALILSAALRVAPVNLFVPIEDNEYVPVQLTSHIETSAGGFRGWVKGTLPLSQLEDHWYWTEVPESERQERSTRVKACREQVREAERMLRVAEAKADLIMERLAALGGTVAATLDLEKASEQRKLDARLDVAYDRIAEARVELEDARMRLRGASATARRAAVAETMETAAAELARGEFDTKSIKATASMMRAILDRIDAGEDPEGWADLRERPKELASLREFVAEVEAANARNKGDSDAG